MNHSLTDDGFHIHVLLETHGLGYRGGGYEEAHRTITAWISLMDALRRYSIIGAECAGIEPDGFAHLPETCPDEEEQAHKWIARLAHGTAEAQQAIMAISAMCPRGMGHTIWRCCPEGHGAPQGAVAGLGLFPLPGRLTAGQVTAQRVPFVCSVCLLSTVAFRNTL